MEWYGRLPLLVRNFFVPQPWLIKEWFVLGVVSLTVTINAVFFAYNCGPLWYRVFVLGHVLVLDLGRGPDAYVDEYFWTLWPHNSSSKSCFLAHQAERRILTCSGTFRASYVLSYASTRAFLIAQGTLLTLWSLECTLIKFWLLLVSHVLCCDVNRTAKNPVRMGTGIFPLVPFFLWYK